MSLRYYLLWNISKHLLFPLFHSLKFSQVGGGDSLIQRNSRKGFGRCRLSCLLQYIQYLSIPLNTNSWDDIFGILFVNSPVVKYFLDQFMKVYVERLSDYWYISSLNTGVSMWTPDSLITHVHMYTQTVRNIDMVCIYNFIKAINNIYLEHILRFLPIADILT